ncbi:MAG TPA: hypothetical protein VLV17_03395 [Anaeromyxobacteraceae bacterium]|nr:hypothetical protein [Anaeromyxobacteraceae bacterium]
MIDQNGQRRTLAIRPRSAERAVSIWLLLAALAVVVFGCGYYLH